LKELGRVVRTTVANNEERKKQNRTGQMSSDRLEKKRKGDMVNNMTDKRKAKRAVSFDCRTEKRHVPERTVKAAFSNVNADAQKYLANFNGMTQMWI